MFVQTMRLVRGDQVRHYKCPVLVKNEEGRIIGELIDVWYDAALNLTMGTMRGVERPTCKGDLGLMKQNVPSSPPGEYPAGNKRDGDDEKPKWKKAEVDETVLTIERIRAATAICVQWLNTDGPEDDLGPLQIAARDYLIQQFNKTTTHEVAITYNTKIGERLPEKGTGWDKEPVVYEKTEPTPDPTRPELNADMWRCHDCVGVFRKAEMWYWLEAMSESIGRQLVLCGACRNARLMRGEKSGSPKR